MDYNFGDRLKELRTQNGLTQKELGDRIGLTKSVVSYYEQQTRTPSPEILIKLAAIFHVTSDYLLGIEKGKSVDISGLNSDDEKVIRMMIELLRKKNGIGE